MLELVGAISCLGSVVLTARRNRWGWPWGILSCFCYLQVFFSTRLYGNALLQLIYIVLSVYGWWHWKHAPVGKDHSLKLSSLPLKQRGWLIFAMMIATLIAGWLLVRTGNAANPYGDSLVTVTSLVAQLLLARKVVENWALWGFSDLVMVIVSAQQALLLTSILYAVLAVVAGVGYVTWKRDAQAAILS